MFMSPSTVLTGEWLPLHALRLKKRGFTVFKYTGMHTSSNSADASNTGTFKHTSTCNRHRIECFLLQTRRALTKSASEQWRN